MSGMINKVADRLKARPLEIMNKVESNLSEIHELRQNIDKLKDQLMSGQAERMLYGAKDIKGLKVITITNGPVNAADIRKMGDQLRDRYPNIVAVLAATAENRPPCSRSAARMPWRAASRPETSSRASRRSARAQAAASPIPQWAAARTCLSWTTRWRLLTISSTSTRRTDII